MRRVQSECTPLEVGQPCDASSHEFGRHSAVRLDTSSAACLRLRVRKNKPQGSFLKRPCTCHISGRQFCLPHRLQPLLSCKGRGTRVWTSTSASFLVSVRKLLTALEIEAPEVYTLKMFRSGHATTLAEEGKTLGHILQAGEWRSAAFLSYLDEDVVDAAQIVEHLFTDSEID